MTALEGFCVRCVTNVAATPDRRCVNDNTLVIAPSTACVHCQWLGGAWSDCTQVRPCPPRDADTWRTILSQQAAAVAKRTRDQNDAARRFTAAHKPKKPAPYLCPTCQVPGRELHCWGICGRCYRLNRRRAAGIQPRTMPPLVPCPVCATPFRAVSYRTGQVRKTCSPPCKAARASQLNRERMAS